MFASAFHLFAQELDYAAQLSRLGNSLLNVVIYASVGIVLAIIGFKLLDLLTPGKLSEEILQKQNIAASILAGAFILGICVIVAAAIHG